MNRVVLRMVSWAGLLAGLSLSLAACTRGTMAIPSSTPETSQPPQDVKTTETPVPVLPASPTVEAGIPSEPVPTPVSEDLRVVYIQDGRLHSWSSHSHIRINAPGPVFQPKISSDGRYAAYLRPVDDYFAELWVVDLHGGEYWIAVDVGDLQTIGGGVLSPNAIGLMPYQVAWLPGSHQLFFNTEQTFQGPGLELLDDLNLYHAENDELSFTLLAGWGGMFTISPKGDLLAVSNPTQVMLADIDGGNYRVVFNYQQVNTYSEYRYYAQPAWSPDGDFLMLALPPADPLEQPPQPTEIWRITVADNLAQLLGQVFAVPFFDTPVSFSPDLSRMAYLQASDEDQKRHLYLARADGTQGEEYFQDEMLLFGGWAGDSLHFTFSSGPDQMTWLGAVGAEPLPLTANPYGITNLRWLDANRFLFVRQDPQGMRLVLGDLQGGELLIAESLDTPFAYDFAVVEQ